MKRNSLLRHLRKYGCYLKREGREHSLWCNPAMGAVTAVPRHTEIANRLGARPFNAADLERFLRRNNELIVVENSVARIKRDP